MSKKSLMSRSLISITLASVLSVGLMNAKTLATVDGTAITEEDFNELKANNPGFDFNKLTKEQQKELVNNLIDNIVIAKEAQKQKLDSTQEFQNAYKTITQNIKNRMLVSAWAQSESRKIAQSANITESDAKAYFDSHQADFNKPNVHARHIVVKTEAEANSIISELNKTPKGNIEKKFIELANKQTIDPANKQAQNGGDLGPFEKEQMVKPFSDAAFSMSAGSYSKTPVKTDFGYHIIYVVKKADRYDFEQIKQPLMRMIQEQKIQQEMKSKVDNLRKKSNIKLSI